MSLGLILVIILVIFLLVPAICSAPAVSLRPTL